MKEPPLHLARGGGLFSLPGLEVFDHAFQGERARGGAEEHRGGGLDRVGALCAIDGAEGSGTDRIFDVRVGEAVSLREATALFLVDECERELVTGDLEVAGGGFERSEGELLEERLVGFRGRERVRLAGVGRARPQRLGEPVGVAEAVDKCFERVYAGGCREGGRRGWVDRVGALGVFDRAEDAGSKCALDLLDQAVTSSFSRSFLLAAALALASLAPAALSRRATA